MDDDRTKRTTITISENTLKLLNELKEITGIKNKSKLIGIGTNILYKDIQGQYKNFVHDHFKKFIKDKYKERKIRS